MHAKIAVLPGDGIGPEVVAEGVKALQAVGAAYGHTFEFTAGLIGGIAIDETGNPLPDETLALCRASDAVLLGRGRRPEVERPPRAGAPRAGFAGAARRAGSLRQPAAREGRIRRWSARPR